MSDDRRMDVLRAIVQDFVRTSEPVGSRALLERHNLGVSAATVRNDMAALEDEGLITAPHTSAGRIPTDLGYRRFVDRLAAIKPLRSSERAAIAEFLNGAVDLDDVVDRTVRLLASLTHQVAVVQYPSLTRSQVRHVELVPLGQSRLMVVLILNTGRVEQRVIESPTDLERTGGEQLLSRIRTAVNAVVVGRPVADAAVGLGAVPDQFEPHERDLARTVAATIDDALVEEREERVVLAGTANLVRSGEFQGGIGEVLDALEQHVVLLKLLNTVGHDDAVAVRIGHENSYAGLHAASMVASAYGTGSDLVAGLGVIGPTRMDYPSTMAAVRAVATYLSQVLGD